MILTDPPSRRNLILQAKAIGSTIASCIGLSPVIGPSRLAAFREEVIEESSESGFEPRVAEAGSQRDLWESGPWSKEV